MFRFEAFEGQRDVVCTKGASQIEVVTSPFHVAHIVCRRTSIGDNRK